MASVADLKISARNLIKHGYDKDTVIYMLSQNNNQSETMIADVVDDLVAEMPSYTVIQKIMRSKLVCDIEGDDPKLTVIDPEFLKITQVSRQRIQDLFSNRFNLKDRIIPAQLEYKPLDNKLVLLNEDGSYTFNTYIPPKWQKDSFYSEGKIGIKKVDKMPAMYEKFFTHLVGNSKDSKASYSYLIKWLANGLKNKNYCILTTIGKQGIGKGVLGEIMRRLFGDNNYYQGGDRMFKGTFNSQIANKRLVYCDELLIKDKEDEDRLKLVVNDYIEIEKKGIDAVEIRNYANFYVSSNNMDAISLTADDRRFSIIELTETKLIEVLTNDEISELLLDKNVEKLAQYLWHYKIDEKEMMKVFVTERTENVRALGLKEWEEWFVFEYCYENKGTRVLLNDAKEAIKEQFGYSRSVGRGKFLDLQNKYPWHFKVVSTKQGEKTVWCIDLIGGKE